MYGLKLLFIITTYLVLGEVAAAQCATNAAIYEIQGARHISPLAGQLVTTRGIVTARAFNGFYVQDPAGDGDAATSDGIFVFGGVVAVGDDVCLTGRPSEFIPGGAASGNLSTTQLFRPTVVVLSRGNALPAPVVIGQGGRQPPNVNVIDPAEIDPPINLQLAADAASNPFNPDGDGIDFYESLEGMLATIEDPVAVSATRTFSPVASELFVLANNGAGVAPADARTARGGISLQPHPDNRGDQNPERVQIQLDGTLFPGSVPAISVGDRLGNVTGVVGYSFGNFEVNATQLFDVFPGGLGPETTRLVGKKSRLTLASHNVLNLDPLAGDDSQRATLAAYIVGNLRSPDVLALQEIQDNNGDVSPGPDGIVEADQTLQALADAIVAAGGPAYAFFDVAPAEGTSGGVPGGNIRNAFLYNPNRVKVKEFFSLTPEALSAAGASNPLAFEDTRNPLLAVFEFRGKRLTVINNHLTSRSGSTPVFGGPQPFIQASEAEREAQVRALNEFVASLLFRDDDGRIVVLGDMNTFEFTNDLAEILPGGSVFCRHDDDDDDDDGDEQDCRILENLVPRLTDDNVYTFNFEGNSQALDHLFVTKNLLRHAEFDIVHVNVDFPRVDASVGSDHEPLLVRLHLRGNDDDDEDDDD